jgi:HTH-type transcriptional regulator / antitoxin HipB
MQSNAAQNPLAVTFISLVATKLNNNGASKRKKFEKEYQNFKLGALIHEARIDKGLTQDQLAEKCGTNKAYISNVENDIKDIRISTLQKIIEIGLGGRLNLSVTL